MFLRLIVCAVLVGVPTAALAQIPREYLGRWAEAVRSCASQGDDGPITIRPNEIVFYESQCPVRSARRDGNATLVVLSCSGEGHTWRQTERLSLGADGRLTTRSTRSDGTNTFHWVRCQGRR
jgi:hypothetical protein